MPSLSYETWSKTEGKPVIDCISTLEQILPDFMYGVITAAISTAYLAGQKSAEAKEVMDMGQFANDLLRTIAEGPK